MSVQQISPPTVERSGGTADGFIVVAPSGMVQDPGAISNRELGAVRALCAQACEQFYDDRPGESANCADPDAFEAPQQEANVEHGVTRALYSGHRHGEGLFGSSALTCDLGEDCYQGFDELLRPVAHDRVTPGRMPLGFGEEWLVSVEGEMSAWASTSVSPATASVVGSLGFSECAGGNSSAPCPFYIGSMEFSLAEDLELPMQCGSATITHVLTDLSVRLEQPAFGMAEEGTAWKGFPPGAIVLDAEGEVDGMPFHVRRANQEPLYLRTGEGWALVQGSDGAWLEFSVPCDGELADVLVWWGYSGVALEGQPPNAAIGVASTVTCPSTQTLAKSVADTDGDLESVRWFVDDVLMTDGISSISFTSGHTLRLVARDERGATRSVEQVVDCL